MDTSRLFGSEVTRDLSKRVEIASRFLFKTEFKKG